MFVPLATERRRTEHVESPWGMQKVVKCPGIFLTKNGHRLVDPAGLDCKDDREALSKAIVIARQIELYGPSASGRRVAVMDSEGREVGNVLIAGNVEEPSH
jgi:hypothetical protein